VAFVAVGGRFVERGCVLRPGAPRARVGRAEGIVLREARDERVDVFPQRNGRIAARDAHLHIRDLVSRALVRAGARQCERDHPMRLEIFGVVDPDARRFVVRDERVTAREMPPCLGEAVVAHGRSWFAMVSRSQ
jgi:hypothetical protein